MPRLRPLVHPDLFGRLASEGFYPALVTFESPVRVAQPSGEPLITEWVPVAGLIDIRATVTAVLRLVEEWRNWRLEYVMEQVTHQTSLDGPYPAIDATMRMVLPSGEIHNVVSRHIDSHSSTTRVMSRIFHPTAVEGQ